MTYAIETLKKEKAIIRGNLSNWNKKDFPRERATQKRRLDDLTRAIDTLQGVEQRMKILKAATLD